MLRNVTNLRPSLPPKSFIIIVVVDIVIVDIVIVVVDIVDIIIVAVIVIIVSLMFLMVKNPSLTHDLKMSDSDHIQTDRHTQALFIVDAALTFLEGTFLAIEFPDKLCLKMSISASRCPRKIILMSKT